MCNSNVSTHNDFISNLTNNNNNMHAHVSMFDCDLFIVMVLAMFLFMFTLIETQLRVVIVNILLSSMVPELSVFILRY